MQQPELLWRGIEGGWPAEFEIVKCRQFWLYAYDCQSVPLMIFVTDLPETNALLKLARQPRADNTPVQRAAILADTSSQLLAGVLRGYARHMGFTLELFEGEFNQIETLIFDPASALHEFRPETVIVYLAAERMRVDFGSRSVAERGAFAEQFAERIRALHETLSSRGYQTLFFNLADPGDGVFGNYGVKVA